MIIYLKAIFNVFKNYKLYSLPILFYEVIFNLNYNKNYNKIKYLKSNIFSDSIPCPYFFLKKIKLFINKNDINTICDLGSGYGKILYYFGKICKYKIDGVEIDYNIFKQSKFLQSKNIRILNYDITKFDLNKNRYDLLILNDPVKKIKDFNSIITKIKKLKYKCFVILINLTPKKSKALQNKMKILKAEKISLNRNIYYCIN